jgi:uncharacterized integral membrane protein
MWLLRSVLAFAGLCAVMIFAFSNLDQRVDVVVFTRTFHDLYLNLVLLCAALAGAAICFAVMIVREFEVRTTLRKVRREGMRLDDELVALRNLPLSGVLPSGKPRPPAANR